MKLIRHHPFALLALVTVLIGAAWHSSIVSPGMRPVLGPVVEIIGAWFIAAMRLVNRHAGGTGFTPLLGFLLGVAPYLLADLALNLWRKRRAARQAPAAS